MLDTIVTGTRLIEESARLPESVRFESEPWTVFYMAGESIRELRMTLENEQINALATKTDVRKTGLKDDQLQRLESNGKHLNAGAAAEQCTT